MGFDRCPVCKQQYELYTREIFRPPAGGMRMDPDVCPHRGSTTTPLRGKTRSSLRPGQNRFPLVLLLEEVSTPARCRVRPGHTLLVREKRFVIATRWVMPNLTSWMPPFCPKGVRAASELQSEGVGVMSRSLAGTGWASRLRWRAADGEKEAPSLLGCSPGVSGGRFIGSIYCLAELRPQVFGLSRNAGTLVTFSLPIHPSGNIPFAVS